jgi:hypothetical protein
MTRKDFLSTSWNKLLKPFISILAIILCTNFLINSILYNGEERLIVIICIGVVLLLFLIAILNLLQENATHLIGKSLPNYTMERLWRFSKAWNYISTLVFGGVLVYLFQKEEWSSVIVLMIIVLERVYHIIFDNVSHPFIKIKVDFIGRLACFLPVEYSHIQ